MPGEVPRHCIHRIREILPGSGHAGHVGLSAKPSLASDLTGHPRHFSCKRAELLDHRVERFFQLQNFAAHVYSDLLRKIARGDGSSHFGDVADLACEIAGHEIDIVGEVLPCASYARHLRLTAKLAVSADLARHTRHLAGESVELVNHSVDRILQFKNLAFHIHSDLL